MFGRTAARRYLISLVVTSLLVGAAPALATPGVPPEITEIISGDQEIDPGETRYYKVGVTGYDEPGTFTFSGTGLTATVARAKTGSVRLEVTADPTAEAGLRSLTVTNPDGLSDTFDDAITVTGTVPPPPPPDGGTVDGHVFADFNGDGIEDAGELGLSGVSVTVTDADSTVFDATTDSNGDFSVAGVAVGDADVVFATPANHTLTTGNDVQVVTVIDDATVNTDAVGYEPPPGVPPVLTSIGESDQIIDPGETRYYRVNATDIDAAATPTFSGDGLTATIVAISTSRIRLQITAAADAEAGLRDLTITNPGGLSDTLTDAITVSGVVPPPPPPPPPEDAAYLDVAGDAGLNLSHHVNACGAPIGVGAAWADIDGDGDQDLYTTQHVGPNYMYRNDGDTNSDGVTDFVDIAGSLGINLNDEASYATVFADYDNDGDQDLFVGTDAGNRLFENQLSDTGSLAFVDVTTTAGIYDLGKVETATWGDVDGDGYLDLYIAKHMSCSGDNIDRLFHNEGDGTFTDWTTYLCGGGAVPCDAVDGLGFSAAIFDFNGDGWQDIYLVNDNIAGSWEPNKMFQGGGPDGSGGWVFTEVGAATGTNLSINGMGVGVGDYDNDGWLDLAFSDAAPGHLLHNDGDGTYSNASISSGVNAETAGAVGWGTAFFDYDNDGWQDLFFAQGTIGSVADMPNALLRNNQNGTFTNVSVETGMNDPQRGRAVAVADFNGDGWVDVFIGNYNAPPLLMLNQAPAFGNTNNSLTVTVEGTISNADGIGTELVLTTAAGTQRQVITSGPNHGGGSQKAAFFGLGSATDGTLSVKWPSGIVQDLGTVSNGVIHLVEPAS